MKIVKIVKVILALMLLTSAILAVFGYWGLYTPSGNHHFDEMDGLIPAFALVASLVIVLLTMIVFLWLKFKLARSKKK